jgi:heme A synthase
MHQNKISIFGALVGGVVIFAATVLFCLPFTLFWALKLNEEPLSVSPSARVLYCAMLGVVLLCTVLGGYVAAAIAKRHEHLNGTLSCCLLECMVIGEMLLRAGEDPQWAQWLLLFACPFFAFIGGDLRFRKQLSRASA